MDKGALAYSRYLSGEDTAIEEIVELYKDGLILYINGFVNNIYTAEDLTQDTFFKIMIKKPLFRINSSFKTWLYTIGRNIALDYLRKNHEVQITIDQAMIEDTHNLQQSYYDREDSDMLQKALKQINPEYGQAIYLSYFEDFKNEEIAKIMKKNKRQVEMLLYRGKQALKEKLLQMGFEYEN